MRKVVVAGNWKMNFTPDEAKTFIDANKEKFDSDKVEVVLCVPYVNLATAVEAVKGTSIKVGAQNMHYMDKGAYTGEISAEMLKSIGVPYVILGHSERREKFGETDTTISLRATKALENGIIPIICVGESQKQRKEKRTEDILRKQISLVLDGLTPLDAGKVIIAYEPIWAIGTGEVATTAQAEEACAFIRERVKDKFCSDTSEKIRILYGGSVTPETAKELFSMPNIDGGLVGGASLQPSFEKVVHYE
jgi:triosephosphate isomerase